MKQLAQILGGLIMALMLVGCGYGRFLETETKGDLKELLKDNNTLHELKTDDKITVSIWDHNNISLGSIFSIYSANETFGKWVLIDSVGNATLPKLGTLYLAGKTCTEASDTIAQLLQKELLSPIVVVKVLNREVTVLGEVKTPGNYLMDKEHTSLYEIIGKSEGFLQYANTKKVQLVRDNVSYQVDLSVHEKSALHGIRMRAGDLVYVPAKRGKNFDLSIKRIIPFASAVTAIAVFTTLLK